MSNLQNTRAFISAWNQKDLDGIFEWIADDMLYHNIPMTPAHGKAEVQALIASFVQMAERVDWKILNIAENENGVVLTERLDNFYLTDGRTVSVRVMGTFEWNTNDQISAWRDYFDLAEFQSQMST